MNVRLRYTPFCCTRLLVPEPCVHRQACAAHPPLRINNASHWHSDNRRIQHQPPCLGLLIRPNIAPSRRELLWSFQISRTTHLGQRLALLSAADRPPAASVLVFVVTHVLSRRAASWGGPATTFTVMPHRHCTPQSAFQFASARIFRTPPFLYGCNAFLHSLYCGCGLRISFLCRSVAVP